MITLIYTSILNNYQVFFYMITISITALIITVLIAETQLYSTLANQRVLYCYELHDKCSKKARDDVDGKPARNLVRRIFKQIRATYERL